MSASLADEIRAGTGSLRSDLDRLETQLRELGNQRNATSKRLQQERSDLDEARARAREYEDQISRLQREERGLLELIEQYNRQLAAVRSQLAEVQLQARTIPDEAQQRYERERVQLERLERQIQSLVKRKEEVQDHLRQRTRDAFVSFLAKSATEVGDAIAAAHSASNRQEAAAAFEEARQKDPSVMADAEARTELRKLLASTQVPTVRELLTKELQAIESRIEARFPGVLSAGSNAIGLDVVQLAYVQRGEEMIIFCPAGDVDTNDEDDCIGPRIAFAVGKTISASQSKLRQGKFERFYTLRINTSGLESDSPGMNIPLHLPDGSSVTLMLSPIPDEVGRVLDVEDQ
jgi:uncharacterized coiled-coil DUF342 family protein